MSFVGNLYGTIASVHHMRDHLQEAEINYKKALRFGCSKAEHIDRYGVLLMMQGRADEALASASAVPAGAGRNSLCRQEDGVECAARSADALRHVDSAVLPEGTYGREIPPHVG